MDGPSRGRKRALPLLGLVALGGLISACGAQPAASKTSFSKYSIAYANSSSAGPIEDAIAGSFLSAGHKLGIKLFTYNNEDSGSTALTNASVMISDHPSAIIDYNLVSGVGTVLGTKFTASHIPCVSINVPIPGCPFANLSNRISGIQAGTIIGAAAKAKGWTAANTTVVAVSCTTCGPNIEHSSSYFYTTVAPYLNMPRVAASSITVDTTHIGSYYVQVADPALTIDQAYTNTLTALQTLPAHQHLAVFAVNDDASIGAWRAIVASGRSNYTLIGGLSGLPEGLAQLRTNPHWIAEGSLFLQAWGEYAIAEAVSILKGAKPPALTPLPQITMTKQTVNTYYPNGSNTPKELPPLVAGNRYLLRGGVLQAIGNVQGVK